jgi:hypothetical protein
MIFLPVRYIKLLCLVGLYLLSCLPCKSQSLIGNIYGIYWNGNAECFATLSQQTGEVNQISIIPGLESIYSLERQAVFNDDSGIYAIVALDSNVNLHLYSVNACDGKLLYSPIISDTIENLCNLHYFSSTKKIYGICWNSNYSCEYFGTLNPYNGVFIPISIVPGLKWVNGGGNTGTAMPDSNLMVIEAMDSLYNQHIYTIDINTGILKYPAPVTTLSYNIEYDTITKNIHGLYYASGQEYYININRFNGNVTHIATVPIQSIDANNLSAFNTDINQYVSEGMDSSDDLFSLNPATGSIIYMPAIIIRSGINLNNIEYGIVRCPLGINAVNDNILLKLYPNPNIGVFTIQIENWNIASGILEVYNVMGEKVYSITLNDANTQVDLSNSPSGIYFYRIFNETSTFVSEGKFVIQK